MKETQTIQTLIEQGWKEYPDKFRKHARCFYKRYDTPTRCNCNDDKPGIQVCIAIGEPFMGFEGGSIEIDICAELSDETWIKMLHYGIGNDVDKALAAIPRILAAWETISNYES